MLFDLDGTLLAVNKRAPNPSALISWQRLLRLVVKLTEVPFNYVLALAERLGLDTEVIFAADRFRRMRGLGTATQSELVPGVVDLLRLLQPSYKLALVTARSRRSAEGFVEKHGLEGRFQIITTRQDTWLQKPSPYPVRYTAKLMGLPATACIMVGDTTMDMRSAKRAGARAVGVLTGLGDREALRRAGADLILEQVGELGPLLAPREIAA